MMDQRPALLLKEYEEVNAHLRANTTQFANWFSLFLLGSLVAAGLFLSAPDLRPALDTIVRRGAVQSVCLIMHILAFVGILTFRRYILAACRCIDTIVQQIGETSGSPIPARFYQWMTDLMAAGYLVSYFIWFALLITA
jgi:hypothetical protein